MSRERRVRYGRVVTLAPSTTIGVSIPIPEPHGDYLQSRRADFGDPQAWDIPAHITLLPPTEVDDATYAAFRGHCAAVASENAPFDVVLRGTGTFRPLSDVVFIQVAQGVSACEALEVELRAVRCCASWSSTTTRTSPWRTTSERSPSTAPLPSWPTTP